LAVALRGRIMAGMTTVQTVQRHVIAALVTNEPGVLAHIAGMFAARGFNIDSLVVGRTENPELSRMTIVVVGDSAVLEQVRKQLQKLVSVVKVVDYKDVAYVERDLMLVQVTTAPSGGESGGASGGMPDGASGGAAGRRTLSAVRRSELIELANLFRAKVVDVGADRLMIELSGTEDKIEAFIRLIQPYGLVELARTGVIAMPRADTGPARVRAASPAAPTIDAGDLPPG
jgi:acetolactate synthase I/III small subunit